MKRLGGPAFGLILLISAGGSFVATYAWQNDQQPAPPPVAPQDGRLTSWLGVEAAERGSVGELEAAYRADRSELEATIARERETLAAMFDDAAASNDEIRAQVERVIAASNAMERRTAEFLLTVRPHLSKDQQRRLLRRMGEGIREGGRYRWRHGQAQSDQDRAGRNGRGGPAAGRGRGHGHGGPPGRGGGRP